MRHNGHRINDYQVKATIHGCNRVFVHAEEHGDKLTKWFGTLQCEMCGAMLFYNMSKGDTELTIEPLPSGRGAEEHATPCPLPELVPVVTRFTCKSGRVAMANFFEMGEEPFYTDCKGQKGQADRVRYYANLGVVTGMVGNTSVYFMPVKDGIDILRSTEEYGEFDSDEDYEKVVAKYRGIPCISLQVWSYQLIDAGDLPEEVPDDVEYLDLEPGEYEVVYHHELRDTPESEYQVWGTLRKVT